MKTKLLSLGTLFICIVSSNVYAMGGIVNFTGEIVQSSCIVNTKDQELNVNIGRYPTTTFNNSNRTSASTPFSINLENCEKGDYIIRFDGNTVDNYPNLLAVDVAKGVGIEITTIDGQAVQIHQSIENKDNPTQTITEGQNTAKFNFKAHYKAYADTVTAGQANGSATFTIAYK